MHCITLHHIRPQMQQNDAPHIDIDEKASIKVTHGRFTLMHNEEMSL